MSEAQKEQKAPAGPSEATAKAKEVPASNMVKRIVVGKPFGLAKGEIAAVGAEITVSKATAKAFPRNLVDPKVASAQAAAQKAIEESQAE